MDGLALGLVYASILFAKSDLAGQPVLQETLMPRVVGILTVADVGWLLTRPMGETAHMVVSPSCWGSSRSGCRESSVVPPRNGIARSRVYSMGFRWGSRSRWPT